MKNKLESFEKILASEAFNPLDRHFAQLMLRLSNGGSAELALAAALASRHLADGHSCISLKDLSGRSLPLDGASGETLLLPVQDTWERALRSSGVVGEPGEHKPLILDAAGRLYLQRYWDYERRIAESLRLRAEAESVEVDSSVLQQGLQRLFPSSNGDVNWQKVAAFAAVQRRFCIITGGPGTGKTWTVARLLALLLEQPGCANLKVRLAAPTGKAAARLQESLAQSLKSLACPASVRERLELENLSTTVHRLLGPIPNSASFRYNAQNPLPVDVLIVDEASMVSLSLMARLLDALKPSARLVLVGDKDQLPPVDPGGVLGDICRAVTLNSFSSAFRNACKKIAGEDVGPSTEIGTSPLSDAVVHLEVNHRTGDSILLNELSTKVNSGQDAKVNASLKAAGANGSPVAWQPLPRRGALKETVREIVRAHYLPVLQAESAEAALRALGSFRVLCALREGPCGMAGLNRLVEEILAEEFPQIAQEIRRGTYAGKPVMVTANSYSLNLFNGDTGVVWRNENGSAFVHFRDETGALRGIARERLPECETAYAMTVHKSQGSEFEHILLLLPEKDSPVLTRELIYTALTRARKSVRVLGDPSVLSGAIHRTAQRNSGLTDAIAGAPIPPARRSGPAGKPRSLGI